MSERESVNPLPQPMLSDEEETDIKRAELRALCKNGYGMDVYYQTAPEYERPTGREY